MRYHRLMPFLHPPTRAVLIKQHTEAIKTALSDNDTAINKNLAENESNGKVTGLTYTITCTVSDTQTLTVKLDINYPVHRQDAFYKIKQWKLNTDTAFEENDTLNLIGGN